MELFERIRRDHREEGLSVRTLARRHRVHRRTVRVEDHTLIADSPGRFCRVRVTPL